MSLTAKYLGGSRRARSHSPRRSYSRKARSHSPRRARSHSPRRAKRSHRTLKLPALPRVSLNILDQAERLRKRLARQGRLL